MLTADNNESEIWYFRMNTKSQYITIRIFLKDIHC